MAEVSEKWWKSTWIVHRAEWVRLAVALVAVIAGGALVGFLMTDWTAPNAVTRLDQRLAEWFVDGRTNGRTDVATWGAFPADTPVKIAVTTIVVVLMLRFWKRWHEAVFIALTLIFEATAFITITAIVRRSRPDVERLLDSPVDSSFPSGHVAAATVYAAFAVVVFWRTRAVWARAFAVVIAVLLPVVVGLARMYQGMHFFSDVVAGVVLGLVSLAVCWRILGRPDDRADADDDERLDAATDEPGSDAMLGEFAHAGVIGQRVSS